jgi:hypothetical protein
MSPSRDRTDHPEHPEPQGLDPTPAPQAEPQPQPPRQTEPPPKPATVMYLGPSIVQRRQGQTVFQVRHGTIYSNGLPADVQARTIADRDFATLFVTPANIGRAMVEIRAGRGEHGMALTKVLRAQRAQR